VQICFSAIYVGRNGVIAKNSCSLLSKPGDGLYRRPAGVFRT
jgi:hypothetical protein